MNKVFLCFLILLCFTRYSLAEFLCENIDYYATYEPIVYTCEAGFFLPANTIGCQECPEHFICNGGTFKFNKEKFQGLTIETVPSTTIHNICADNFPVDLYAIYTPHTITINWDDGTNITQNTCQYGGAITLPPTPVRPGYVFGGWRVKNQN